MDFISKPLSIFSSILLFFFPFTFLYSELSLSHCLMELEQKKSVALNYISNKLVIVM